MLPLNAQQQAIVDGTTHDAFWDHWLDRHVNHNDTTEDGFPIVRCESRHYVVSPQKDAARYRQSNGGSSLGFGGHQWTFALADGTTLTSNDVWSQGLIPLKYRSRMPDNAERVGKTYDHFAPWGTPEEATLAQLSVFEHPTMAVDFTPMTGVEEHDGTVYTVEWDEEHRREAPLAESQVWTSEVRNVPQPNERRDWFGAGGTRIIDHHSDEPSVHHWPGRRDKPQATRFGGRMQQVQDGWHTVMLDLDVPVRLVPSSTTGHWHLYIDVAMPWWRYRRLLRALKTAGIIEPGYYSVSVARKHTALRLPWVKKEAMEPKRPAGDPF